MKHIQPDYYSKFHCLGKDCPLTCCAGWTIAIDEDTLAYYESLPGNIGRRVRKAVNWEGSNFRLREGRCLLLTEEGLCSLQLEAGEEALCGTCRLYPRHTEEFKEWREYSLNLSCPAAAWLILFDQESPALLMETTDDEEEEIDFDDFDEQAFLHLISLREEILQKMPLEAERGSGIPSGTTSGITSGIILGITSGITGPDLRSEKLRDYYEKTRSVLEELEVIDHGWPAHRLQMIRSLQDLFTQPDYAQIISAYQEEWGTAPVRRLYAYFIYVYLAGAVYDEDIPGKLVFSTFCTTWIQFLWLAERHAQKAPLSREAMVILASRLAREVEHDEDNYYRISDVSLHG